MVFFIRIVFRIADRHGGIWILQVGDEVAGWGEVLADTGAATAGDGVYRSGWFGGVFVETGRMGIEGLVC